MTLLVSVVVPTYRRPQLLDRCLRALLAQNFPPHAYEIIVVDDGPEDPGTRQLLSEWSQRLRASFAFLAPPLITPIPVTGGHSSHIQAEVAYQVQAGRMQYYPRLIYLAAWKTQGPAAARNQGWQAAGGEIVAFTDDDCIPDPNWITNGLSAFVDGVAAVSGRIIVPLSPDPTDHELNTTGLERSDFITANCFYRRSVLEQVGGFDERFSTAWREDSDLFFTVRERNYSLAWATGALVVHPVRPEAWGSSLRSQRKSFYNALLYKKHPQLYQRYIQPAPPWNYYAILIGVFISATGLMFNSPAAAILGALIWVSLTARFCRRRLSGTSHAPRHVAEMVVTSIFIPFLSIYWRLRGAIHWRVFFL
jgi:glycosyltransferase involved in cell wall biosynthesis